MSGRLIFFDVDGPILDVSERYWQIHKHILRQFGITPLSKDIYWDLKRNKISEREILSRLPDSQNAEVYLQIRSELIEDVIFLKYDRVWEGGVEFLIQLSEYYSLYAISMRKNRKGLEEQFKNLYLESVFEDVFLPQTTDIPNWKAKAQVISGKVDINSHQVILIGDTETEVLAAKALNIPAVAITTGIRSKRILEQYKPDFLYENIFEIDFEIVFEQK